MHHAAARLGKLADHLAEECIYDEARREHTAAHTRATESTTIALPEKLSDDHQWRVHRCVLVEVCADKDKSPSLDSLYIHVIVQGSKATALLHFLVQMISCVSVC
jgi:hypothetical protein